MPYIITIAERGCGSPCVNATRHAVATLDEARLAARTALDGPAGPGIPEARAAARTMPETGGTIGPLPDGTVITVAPINGYALAGWVANTTGEDCRVGDAVDRYNAAQR